MTYSSQRERETLNQCDTVLTLLNELTLAIKRAPRLTTKEESLNSSAIKTLRKPYENIAKNCVKNLESK